MTVERALRGLAGTVVLASLALGHWLHPGFLWLTAFAGLNLLQSAFTNACPAMTAFRWLGLPEAGACSTEPLSGARGAGRP
jgi:hypothetical protein